MKKRNYYMIGLQLMVALMFLHVQTTTAQYCSLTPNNPGPNLVVQGSFDAGVNNPQTMPTYFSSDYTYQPAPATPSTVIGSGEISVLTDAHLVNLGWAGSAHTGSNFLICDGKTSTPDIVWEQTITTTIPANSVYYYEFWVNNLIPSSNYGDPSVRFQVIIPPATTPVVLSTYTIPESPDQWEKVCGTWTSGSSAVGSITLQIRLVNSSFVGYDLGIDDISFSKCTDKQDFQPQEGVFIQDEPYDGDNYSQYSCFAASSAREVGRTILYFDLSSLPQPTYITNASLTLDENGYCGLTNEIIGLDNNMNIADVRIAPLTGSPTWSTSTVTWATAPSPSNAASITGTTYTIDFANQSPDVLDMTSQFQTDFDPTSGPENFRNGMVIALDDESWQVNNYRAIFFENPVLEIEYSCISGSKKIALDGEYTGIENEKGFMIYPNPSKSGVFKFSVSEDPDYISVVVYDMQGKIIENIEDAKGLQTIDLSKNESGMYLVKVKMDDQFFVEKMIIK